MAILLTIIMIVILLIIIFYANSNENHNNDELSILHKNENELIEKIEELIRTRPVIPFGENSFPFIEDIFVILAENKEICAALLGPNGDIAFLHRIEAILSEHSLKVLQATFPEHSNDLQYAYSFCLSGCVGLIKAWLAATPQESPEHMAKLTFRLIMNALTGQR